MLLQSPPKLSLAHLPTPLRALERLNVHVEQTLRTRGHTVFPKLWIKSDDQSGFGLSGNKVRKLEYLLAAAKAEGADTVITCGGIQSNHCRATAFACAQLGLKCILLLRDDPGFEGRSSSGQANHFLDTLCGAEVEVFSEADYRRDLTSLFKQHALRVEQNGGRAYSIPVGGSNGLGAWGYISAVEELAQQCKTQGVEPDLLVCASGSGGTQAGLALGRALFNFPARVQGFAVCDSSAYFERKIREDILACATGSGLSAEAAQRLMANIELQVNDSYIGPGYAKSYREVYDTIALLARLEGLVLDPVYTGKAMYGLLSEIYAGRCTASNIIFVHTGGSFGVFPHAEAF